MNEIGTSRSSNDHMNLLVRYCALCWYARAADSDSTSLQELVEDMMVIMHGSSQGGQQLSQDIALQFMSDGRAVFSRETGAILRGCAPFKHREIQAVKEILANTDAAMVDSLRLVDPSVAALASKVQTWDAGSAVIAMDKSQLKAPVIATVPVLAAKSEINQPPLELEGESKPLVLAQEDIEIPSIPPEIGREDDQADAYEDAPAGAPAGAGTAEEAEDDFEKDADETDEEDNFSLADLFDEDEVVQDGGSLTLLEDEDDGDQDKEDDDDEDEDE